MHSISLAVSLVVVAGSSSAATPEPATSVRDASADAKPTPDRRRWFAGDVHMHVAPPDTDVTLGVGGIAAAARAAKLDFVVLTPHLWPGRRGAGFAREWRTMAAAARSETPTLIPGVEWTTAAGHFTVAGADATTLGSDFLASAHQAGAFISVNHPFAVPTKILGIPASHYDMSYRPWTTAGTPAKPIDGVEVFNLPLALANLLSRPGGSSGEDRAWWQADRLVRTEHRRVTAVGGTDNHTLVVLATTWVLAIDASEAAILDALRAGATCVGGVEAGSFRARGDADWVRIGDTTRATRSIALAWDGLARLFVDGVDRGEHSGEFVHKANGILHTYRIVRGASRCGSSTRICSRFSCQNLPRQLGQKSHWISQCGNR